MIDLNQEELTILNNVLVQINFPLGDAKVILPILEKIQSKIEVPKTNLSKSDKVIN